MEDDRGRGHREDMKEKEARAYVGQGHTEDRSLGKGSV